MVGRCGQRDASEYVSYFFLSVYMVYVKYIWVYVCVCVVKEIRVNT